ncbi:MAG TPA: hypothetical protein VGD98_01235 [Ktedonobacteraceae bacterium]
MEQQVLSAVTCCKKRLPQNGPLARAQDAGAIATPRLDCSPSLIAALLLARKE